MALKLFELVKSPCLSFTSGILKCHDRTGWAFSHVSSHIKQPTKMPYYTGVTINYMLKCNIINTSWLAALHMFINDRVDFHNTKQVSGWMDSSVLKSSQCKLLGLELPADSHNFLPNTSTILQSSTTPSAQTVLIIVLHVLENQALQNCVIVYMPTRANYKTTDNGHLRAE